MFEAAIGAGSVAVRVRDAATALADDTRACSTWTTAERTTALEHLRAAEAALAQARAHLLVAVRDSGQLERPGDRSFEGALGRALRTGSVEATRQVRQADTLVSMPSVATAVRDGLVPLGHLDTVARVAATAAPEVAAHLRTPAAQDRMVTMARSLSAPEFARSLAQYVAAQDPAALESAHEAQRRERFLTLSSQPHGLFLKGRLDLTSAEALRIALDLMDQHPDEHRTAAQATADALVLLAERACSGTGTVPSGVLDGSVRRAAAPGDGPGGTDLSPDEPATSRATGSASRPHLSLLVPAETFVELLRHQEALDTGDRDSGDLDSGDGDSGDGDQLALGIVAGLRPGSPSPGPGSPSPRPAGRDRVAPVITPGWSKVAPWSPVPPATLEDGTPVPMSELARALCDADVTRIVMSAEGIPLDVGRSKRLFTAAMRRAAVARDQQCIWNGCAAPASRCQMHHLRWWDAHHGPTSVTNAALVCGHHHRLIHQLDLTVQRLAAPPGWVAYRRREGRAVPPGTPGVNREPMRYTFRDHTGRAINEPDDRPDDTS